jgi:hypothetical protein
MAKQLRFDVEDKVRYIFGDGDEEYYAVVATRKKPRVRKGGPDDGKLLHVNEGKDYIIVEFPILPNQISPYIHVTDSELDPH